jgi:hypothetical protein
MIRHNYSQSGEQPLDPPEVYTEPEYEYNADLGRSELVTPRHLIDEEDD